MAKVTDRIKRRLRHRNLLRRPSIIRDLTKIAETEPTHRNHLTVFHSGDALYARMIADVAEARSRVHCELYTFQSDATGWPLADALAERAEAGREVRVIYDAVGSWETDEEMFEFMRRSGVQVLEYRPVVPWKRRFGIFGRDHRKVLVVDDGIGYVGGFNVSDRWSERQAGEKAWRDTHVRAEGPAALDLAVLFAETWHRETGDLLPIDREAVRRRHVEEEDSADSEGAGTMLIVGGRGGYRRRIRKLYKREIEGVSEQLLLTNPYLVPDHSIREALCRAAERGVEVCLMLPEVSDVKMADWASRRSFARYLSKGVRIFLYQKSILHAKCVVSDEDWASVGSANIDSLSLNHNLEANAVTMDAEAVETLRAQFWKDLEDARELDEATWRDRPFKSRLYEWLASWLRPWL